MNYYVHDIDPIAFYFGSYPFAWYWLAYMFGVGFVFVLGIRLINKLNLEITPKDFADYIAFGWFSSLSGQGLATSCSTILATIWHTRSKYRKFGLAVCLFMGFARINCRLVRHFKVQKSIFLASCRHHRSASSFNVRSRQTSELCQRGTSRARD